MAITVQTVFNPPAVTVFWYGKKQWKFSVCDSVYVCLCVKHQKSKKEFCDGVGVVLWSGYVTQNNR
jgi:hypothetical protein